MSNLLLRYPLYVFGHAYIEIEEKELRYLRYVYMSNLLLRYPLYVFGHAYIEIEEKELFKICVYVQFIVKVPSICIWSRIY